MSALSNAREAIVDAIDNWPALQSGGASIFKMRLAFGGDDVPERLPGTDELPAYHLMRAADGSTVDQVKNRIWEYTPAYQLLIYTADWDYAVPEGYELEVVKALYQSSNGAGQEYIKAATGFYPHNDFGIVHKLIKSGDDDQNTKMVVTTITFKLRVRFDALG